MYNEREKLFKKFCEESKTLDEAFEKMKEYDKKNNPKLSNVYIDTNNSEQDVYMTKVRKK
jgi:hypothetical protein